jgi:autotransporter translocation and assembly factor TamB
MTVPEETEAATPARNWRRIVRIVLLCVIVAVILFIAATGWLRG